MLVYIRRSLGKSERRAANSHAANPNRVLPLWRRRALIDCRWVVLVVAMLVGAPAWALDLGEFKVSSGLNERLQGLIALHDSAGLGAMDMTASLASPEDFARRGLERFSYLGALRFRIVPEGAVANKRLLVRVSSTEPMPDAYLNFLLQVRWPGGSSIREYAVVLGAGEKEPATNKVSFAQIAPSDRTAGAVPTKATQAERTERPQASNPPPQRELLVKPTDTLWRIAVTNRPASYDNVQQYVLAIFRENPKAFLGGNINGLMAGVRLRLPSARAELSPAEAIRETGRQNTAWRENAKMRQLKILAQEAAQAPQPSLAERLDEVRQQVRQQLGRLDEQNRAIAKLASELAALRVMLNRERQAWAEEFAWWRLVALAGVFAAALLLVVGSMALVRRRASKSSAEDAAPDYHIGESIEDRRVKINLAQAQIGVGNLETAEEILAEVLAEGDEEERREAQALLDSLKSRDAG